MFICEQRINHSVSIFKKLDLIYFLLPNFCFNEDGLILRECWSGPNYQYYSHIKISELIERNKKSFYRIKVDTKLGEGVVDFILKLKKK